MATTLASSSYARTGPWSVTTAQRVRSPPPCPTRAGWRVAQGSWSRSATCARWRRVGTRRLTVGVTWTPAGEGTYRAVLAPAEARTVPTFMVVGGADATATVVHCVDRLQAVDGVRWAGVVTAGSRVVATAGDGAARRHLDEVGNRMLAILRSLEDQHVAGFVRLRFEQAFVVGASLGRHALVACTDETDEHALLATIDEVRAILADHDLSSVPTQDEPAAARPRGRRRDARRGRRGGRTDPAAAGRGAVRRCGCAGAAPGQAAVRAGDPQPQPRGNTSNVDAWVTPSPWPPPRRIPSRNSSGSQPSQPRPSM